MEIKKHLQKVTAFAPATAANLGVGFDILGMALSQAGDTVIAQYRDELGVRISHIDANFSLSMDANKNIAGIAVQALLADYPVPKGFALHIQKGIPLGSGMGGSAASAVAALVAVNGFFDVPLTPRQLLPYAVYAEGVINGAEHADNVAPALLGGLVLCQGKQVHALPAPPLVCVVLHVDVVVRTLAARQVLPSTVSLSEATMMSAKLGAWVQALYQQDVERFAQLLQENPMEQCRLSLWPHYPMIKDAVFGAGAKALCVSGSGPCLLAWAESKAATVVAQAMVQTCEQQGWSHQVWINETPAEGAKIMSKE